MQMKTEQSTNTKKQKHITTKQLKKKQTNTMKKDSNKNLLQLQNSSKSSEEKQSNNNYSEEVNEVEERKYTYIDGTPFTIVEGVKGRKVIIVMGNREMAPKEFETPKEAKEYINKKPWELITAMCCAICEDIPKVKRGEQPL